MIAAGKTKACQPAKYLRIPNYAQLRRSVCDVSSPKYGELDYRNKCDKVLCETVAKASKGLTKDQIKRLGFALKWLDSFVWSAKKCRSYAEKISKGLPDDLRFRAYPLAKAECVKKLFEGRWKQSITYLGRRYGSWKDFLFKEPRVGCPPNRQLNAFSMTPHCIKPILSLAKIKASLQRKYGRMTFKLIVAGPVYKLEVIVHKMVNKRSRDTGKRSLEVDGYTGKLLYPKRIRPILPFTKIKRLLRRKYGRITYKKVNKGSVYRLEVIIHREINKATGRTGGATTTIDVDGHTGRVIRVLRPNRYIDFDD